MKTRIFPLIIGITSFALSILQQASASGITYKDGDKYVKLGGRIQLQYYLNNPDDSDSTDDLFFRRFRPYIEGSLHEGWSGKLQWEMGKAENENELSVKNAYIQYHGKEFTTTIGNGSFPFSREKLTSAKKQQLVERTFVGDHNYGTPSEQVGIYLKDKKGLWHIGIAQAAIDPDNSKLDFDTLANKNKDFNEGWMIGGRLEFGDIKFEQTNLSGDNKLGFGFGAFSWRNDDDNLNKNGEDVYKVTGLEISAALRSGAWSIDAQANSIGAELTDPAISPQTIDGIYKGGKTTLNNIAVEAGFLLSHKDEIVLGLQSQDADGYAEQWNRTSFGYNHYIKNQDIKLQATFRINDNKDGIKNRNVDELFIQMQYVF